jgi:hypothetical protein
MICVLRVTVFAFFLLSQTIFYYFVTNKCDFNVDKFWIKPKSAVVYFTHDVELTMKCTPNMFVMLSNNS